MFHHVQVPGMYQRSSRLMWHPDREIYPDHKKGGGWSGMRGRGWYVATARVLVRATSLPCICSRLPGALVELGGLPSCMQLSWEAKEEFWEEVKDIHHYSGYIRTCGLPTVSCTPRWTRVRILQQELPSTVHTHVLHLCVRLSPPSFSSHSSPSCKSPPLLLLLQFFLLLLLLLSSSSSSARSGCSR